MKLPYKTILDELKTGPKTMEYLCAVDKEGDTRESLICLVARGWVKSDDFMTFRRDEEALERERNA